MKYDVNYFINKFESIPEERWTTGSFVKNDMRCVLGHCGDTDFCESTLESTELRSLFQNSIIINASPVHINDAAAIYYHHTAHIRNSVFLDLGDSPKERVLNALYLIAAGVTID